MSLIETSSSSNRGRNLPTKCITRNNECTSIQVSPLFTVRAINRWRSETAHGAHKHLITFSIVIDIVMLLPCALCERSRSSSDWFFDARRWSLYCGPFSDCIITIVCECNISCVWAINRAIGRERSPTVESRSPALAVSFRWCWVWCLLILDNYLWFNILERDIVRSILSSQRLQLMTPAEQHWFDLTQSGRRTRRW